MPFLSALEASYHENALYKFSVFILVVICASTWPAALPVDGGRLLSRSNERSSEK